MGAYLRQEPVIDAAIVPYDLEKTLSSQGTVTRGVCGVRDGCLSSVDELLSIEKKDGKIFDTNSDGSRRYLAADTPVSMNFWGFPESIVPHFRTYFDNFLAEFAADTAGRLKAECYLPRAADWFIREGIVRIRVLKADSQWFGVTYREDRDAAIEQIRVLTAEGVYPPVLW
jgi:hypothetical protein